MEKITFKELFSSPHIHWEFVAYDEKLKDGSLSMSTEVSVIGYREEEEALKATKNIVKRTHYWLKRVFECSTCKNQEEMLKEIKKHI